MSEAAGDDPLPKLTPCVCADRKGACGGSVAAPNPLVDPLALDAAAVAQITAMGFSEPAARRGLLSTDGSVDRAVQWVTAHAGDADLNEPLPEPAAAAAAADEPEPLFAFGVVADVQYANADVGTNFLKTVTRYYRHALDCLSLAVSSWLHDAPGGKPVAFVAQLGDLIDGKNADVGQTAAAAADVHGVLSRLGGIPVHSAIGNHEVMNWPRSTLHAGSGDKQPAAAGADDGAAAPEPAPAPSPTTTLLSDAHLAELAAPPAEPAAAAEGKSGEGGYRGYRSFVPHEGWRFVVLDAFAISTLGYPPDHPCNQKAWELLDANNPNDCTRRDIDLSQGMTGVASRWMPYNGAHGEEQLAWLEAELGAAKAAGERVVVLTHVGVCPGVCDDDTLAWDYDKVLGRLHAAGNVAAVLSGHDHKGGYVRDASGVHHLTFKAPLETPPPAGCHAIVEVSEAALLVRGWGRQESRLLSL